MRSTSHKKWHPVGVERPFPIIVLGVQHKVVVHTDSLALSGPGDGFGDDVRSFIRLLARRWLTFLFVMSLVLGALVGKESLKTPLYRAKARVVLGGAKAEDIAAGLGQQALSVSAERQLSTEIELIKSRPVRDVVEKALGAAAPKVAARAVDETFLIELSVADSSPTLAKKTVDLYTKSYLAIRRDQASADLRDAAAALKQQVKRKRAQLKQLDQEVGAPATPATGVRSAKSVERDAILDQIAQYERQIGQLEVDAPLKTGGVRLVETAALPDQPFSPNPLLAAIYGLFFGAILGAGAATLVDTVDERVKGPAELERFLPQLPVLALIPSLDPRTRRRGLVTDGYAAEAYRGLRTSLQFLSLDRPLRVVLITSAMPGEGKTTTAANLAAVIAQSDRSVVVVDCDLRRPGMHTMLNEPGMPGVTTALTTGEDPLLYVRRGGRNGRFGCARGPVAGSLRRCGSRRSSRAAGNGPGNPRANRRWCRSRDQGEPIERVTGGASTSDAFGGQGPTGWRDPQRWAA
jgi:polysaccharide biosynthesis transport protein